MTRDKGSIGRLPKWPWIIAAAAVMAACVTVEENALTAKDLTARQKIFVLVFPSPGPQYYNDTANVGAGIESVPGLGLLVQSADDAKTNALAQSLPSSSWTVSPDTAAATALVGAL